MVRAAESSIPSLFRRLRRWLIWKQTDRGKQPREPRSTLDLDGMLDFERVAGIELTSTSGIGLCMTEGIQLGSGWLVSLDVDGCVNPLTNDVEPWAQALLAFIGPTYVSITPSGTGLRVWLRVRRRPDYMPVLHPRVRQIDGVDKRPEVQVFGLGPAGYVTETGVMLEGAVSEVATVEDLTWLPELWDLDVRDTAPTNNTPLPVGTGDPPTLDEIEERVQASPDGPQLLAGDWAGLGHQSASEGAWELAKHALRAARNHGDKAIDFLLQRTRWGDGMVESKDPGKYGKRRWWEKDLRRLAAKEPQHARTAADVFEAIEVDEKDPPAKPKKAPTTPADVVARWRQEGELVHQPTGLVPLDEMTRGGPTYGSLVVVVGAPDAGKTLLVAQVLDTMRRAGVLIGILAVDEDDDGLTTRFLQRAGISRETCERRTTAGLEQMTATASELGDVLFYDDTWTVDTAAADLAQRAALCNRRAAFGVDSLQHAKTQREPKDKGARELIEYRMRKLKLIAKHYDQILFATSEMARQGYANQRTARNTATMALGKEASGIEYQARILIGLRVVLTPGGEPLIGMEVAKNKLGTIHRLGEEILLRLDRARQIMTVEDGAAVAARTFGLVLEDAARLVVVLAKKPGISTEELRTAMRGACGGSCSKDRVADAIRYLDSAIEVGRGKGTRQAHRLTGVALPVELLDCIPEEDQDVVADALGKAFYA